MRDGLGTDFQGDAATVLRDDIDFVHCSQDLAGVVHTIAYALGHLWRHDLKDVHAASFLSRITEHSLAHIIQGSKVAGKIMREHYLAIFSGRIVKFARALRLVCLVQIKHESL